MNEFPKILRRLRESRGLKQKVLSELCGLYPTAIGKYERGIHPDVDSLVAIADFFGVTVDYLLGRKNS